MCVDDENQNFGWTDDPESPRSACHVPPGKRESEEEFMKCGESSVRKIAFTEMDIFATGRRLCNVSWIYSIIIDSSSSHSNSSSLSF